MSIMLAFLAAAGPAGGSSPGSALPAERYAKADLVLFNGHVITMADPEPTPTPTAVAVVDRPMGSGRIMFVGDDAAARALAGPQARIVDLHGAVVVPGLVDSHAHLHGLADALATLDLVGTTSAEDIAARVKEAAAKTVDKDAWILGRGWDQNDWAVKEFPHKELLDAAAPGRPVVLRRVDGHATWASSAALARAGITAKTPDPDGGRIVREASGEPTGVLVDNAADLVGKVVPEPSGEERMRRLKVAVDHCLALGLTGVHDAGATLEQVRDYNVLKAAMKLKLRLYVMLADDPATLDALLRGEQAHPTDIANPLLTIRAVKLYADGALGSRGALLLQDYSDDPGNRGLPVSTPEHLIDVARRAGRAGFQVCTHAIGDAGNRRVLDVYEQVLGELKLKDPRWRIEHAQVLDPADIPRFAKLGVIAAMQPVHCTSDMDWVPARLGEKRAAGAYAWRSLLDSGAHLCFGTDFPVESADPLPGLYAARTRMHADGTPAGGWHPEQCLTGREALALYTAGPAYAAFEEKQFGRIAPGFGADLTVLSGDPVAAPPADLLKMKALMTIVDGQVRYEAPR